MYRLHGGDNVQIKRYFVSFWNGVDLRYRLLKGPKIRISIAGIIISRVIQYSFIKNNSDLQARHTHALVGFDTDFFEKSSFRFRVVFQNRI